MGKEDRQRTVQDHSGGSRLSTAPVGVFDSGIGGLSVLQALRAELPQEHFVYLADNGHAPYGERSDDFVLARTLAIAHHLQTRHGIKALVIACNTATAAAVQAVRARYPRLTVVGVEPALKPAMALSRTGHIGVMATRGTVGSDKFQALLQTLRARHPAPGRFTVQACDGLATTIEQMALSPDTENALKLRAMCVEYTRLMGRFGTQPGEIDTLVLGCTHYVFASPVLRDILGTSIRLVDNGPAVARHTHRLLAAEALLAGAMPAGGATHWCTTGDATVLQRAAMRWLDLPQAPPIERLTLPH